MLVGCGSSEPSVPKDVRKACEVRASWAHRIRTDCTNCLALSAAPACGDCDLHPQAGRCSDQQQAKDAEPSCKDTDRCVRRCDRTDCACIERCYATNNRCHDLAAAVDACTTKVCDAYCR